jgi:MFS family permease
MDNPRLPRLAQKTTWTLFSAQSLSSAGLITTATVNAIAATKLSHNPALAGVPFAVYLLCSALSAPLWGLSMDKIGRRGGLALGLITGVIGALLATKSIIDESFLLFILGLGFMGVAQAAMQLGRFAAAEVHPPDQRGKAISNVVLGGTVGAILGPFLVGATGSWASQAGYDELVGPFLAASVTFSMATMVIFTLLRPDPRELGREVSKLYPESLPSNNGRRPVSEILRQPASLVAVTSMVLAQMVMVMVMAITSLHMQNHQHDLNNIALVISSHTIGMFAFSLISGRLADRFGRGPVIMFGAGVLFLACLAATLSPALIPLSVALFLLGLGWNFCYVAGSSLLADQLAPEERAQTQGVNDLLVGFASAVGSLGSGFVFASVGYNAMGVVGAAVTLVPILMTLRWQLGGRSQPSPA